jgi:hypothetical protein
MSTLTTTGPVDLVPLAAPDGSRPGVYGAPAAPCRPADDAGAGVPDATASDTRNLPLRVGADAPRAVYRSDLPPALARSWGLPPFRWARMAAPDHTEQHRIAK